MLARQVVGCCVGALTGKLSRLGHDCEIVCFLSNPTNRRDKARKTPVTMAVWGIQAVVCALGGDWVGELMTDWTRQMADFAREPSDSQIDGKLRIGSKRQAAGARRGGE